MDDETKRAIEGLQNSVEAALRWQNNSGSEILRGQLPEIRAEIKEISGRITDIERARKREDERRKTREKDLTERLEKIARVMHELISKLDRKESRAILGGGLRGTHHRIIMALDSIHSALMVWRERWNTGNKQRKACHE